MTDATDAPDDDARRDPRAPDPTAPERRAAFGGGRFGLLSEVLVVGLGVSVLSLPVVTVLPALAAGAAHVRRHLTGETDRVVDLWHEFVAALRGVWPYALASLALLVLLWFNTAVAGTGLLPGGTGVLVLSLAVAAMLAVVLLRAAGGWRRGASWRQVMRDAGARAGDDLAGSGLLVVAMGLCGVIVWMLAPLAVLVPGLLALAVVAVEHRAATRTR
ncbi:hypothetical protein ACFUMH_12795 [Cellulomonas sp. NPDC057328]|uniref:hypothetical protein n=1 Tax=Cellulomonas sp. NPDC057328 TaxID=3346101 RepID=UPI0036441AA8